MATNLIDKAVLIQQKTEAVQSFVMHHMRDSSIWHFLRWEVQLPPFLSLHALMVILSAVFLVVIFGVVYRKQDAVPRGLTNLLELFVLFVRDQIAVPFLGREDGRRMTPMFCSFFFFILTMNLLGLVPCFRTATSNISVTGALAVVVLGVMIFGALYRQGLRKFCKGFVPSGVPFLVLIILVPIEVIGLFIKAFALCVRLFANEFAGHVVIMFLLGLVVIFGAIGFPFILLAIMVYMMEVGIAFLQAYIFTLLSAVFIGQRYHPEH